MQGPYTDLLREVLFLLFAFSLYSPMYYFSYYLRSFPITSASNLLLFISYFYLSYLLIYSIYFVYAMHYAPAFQAYCSITFLLSVYTTYMLSHLSALSQHIFCIKFPQEFHFICRKLHIFP